MLYDDAIDRAAYFDRCWPNREIIREHVLEKVVEDGDDVIVLYRCLTRDGRMFRNMEMLSFEGSRLKAVNVYFGAGYKDGVFQTYG
ncbi:hypothetical protein [Mesorhizobium xinjiangense]|uniref:hypothetical protein n=1 Tax=Mesorhizobium xinjiangense TaxID=2678685 RepID=UPI0012EE9BE1|nr:hypothetical protein [Mesorhizobium xinjiangense]